MKRLVLCLVILILSTQTVHATGTTAGFSESSVTGCYVASLSGFVLPDPSNPLLQLPIATQIRFCADGKGSATAKGKQNIGGLCIIRQKGTAEYSVKRNGMGKVKATFENMAVSPGCGSLTPPIGLGEISIFKLKFGITRSGCLPTIGTELLPEGGLPIPIVTEGEACPQ